MMAHLFPTLLYGGSLETYKQWRTFMKSVWADPHDTHFGSALTFRSVDDVPGWVVVHHQTGLADRRGSHWRLEWVGRCLMPQGDYGETTKRERERRRDLVVRGTTEYVWFALSMLQSGRLISSLVLEETGPVTEFARSMLRALLYWIPDFISLLPKCVVGQRFLYPYTFSPFLPETAWAWYLHFLKDCGYIEDPLRLKGVIRKEYGGDLVAALQDQGLVADSQGRLVLPE